MNVLYAFNSHATLALHIFVNSNIKATLFALINDDAYDTIRNTSCLNKTLFKFNTNMHALV
jgi:hypothetical protein